MRGIVELVLAVAAAVGCVLCWVAARSPELAPPVTADEPSRVVVAYDPTLISLALLLAAAAGVLAVAGVGALRTRR